MLASALIEGIQFVFKRGVVEFDDVFNNTLGTLIGYGLAIALLELFFTKKRSISRILLGFVPLFLTLGAFGILRQLYIMQPYGNLACAPAYRINMRKADVSGKSDWGQEQSTAKVYETTVADGEGTLELAREVFAKFGAGIDGERTDAYDETVLYYSADSDYSVWIEYRGLSYDLTDYSMFDDAMETVSHASEQEIRSVLERLEINVPKEAAFEETGEGQYSYQQETPKTLEAESVSLGYQLDTKGFYQPVYEFACRIDGEEVIVGIPALK